MKPPKATSIREILALGENPGKVACGKDHRLHRLKSEEETSKIEKLYGKRVTLNVNPLNMNRKAFVSLRSKINK